MNQDLEIIDVDGDTIPQDSSSITVTQKVVSIDNSSNSHHYDTRQQHQTSHIKVKPEVIKEFKKKFKKKKRKHSKGMSKTSAHSIYTPKINMEALNNHNNTISSQQFFVGSPKLNISIVDHTSPKSNQVYQHSTFKTTQKYRTSGNTPKWSRKGSLQHDTESSLQPSYLVKKKVQTAKNNDQVPNVPKTYKDWKQIQITHKLERLAKMQPNEQIDKERRQRIKNIETRIRTDALASTIMEKTQVEEGLEDGLRQKLSRLKQINVSEEPFTYSLQKVHDRSFIHKILPCIQKQQIKHSPFGASHSKSPNLLRNTFSVEMYSEFLKYKYDARQKKANDEQQQDNQRMEHIPLRKAPDIKVENEKYLSTQSIKFPQVKTSNRSILSRSGRGSSQHGSHSMLSAIGLSFKEKMAKMMQKRKEEEKRQQLLEQLKNKKKNSLNFDANFFEALEQKDMDNHLIEIIMFEINKLFMKEMMKYRGVTSEYNAMLKRKNLLEAKLFKKRYEKVQKHLNGNHNLEHSLNPFKKAYQPSIFNDKMNDSKMEIPLNRELYENVIKEAFNDLVDEKGEKEANEIKNMSDKEIIERIKQKFRRKVMEKGPSILTQDFGKGTFLEQMMNLCNYSKISKKIQGGMVKFDKSQIKRHRNSTQPITPFRDDELNELNQSKSSNFFITQPSQFPLISLSNNVTPRQSHRNLGVEQQKSPRLTTYLNFLNSSRLGSIQKLEDTSILSVPPPIRTLRMKSNLRMQKEMSHRKTMSTFNPNQSKMLNKTHNNRSSILTHIIDEVNKDIQVKESIKERAKSRTLSQDDWQQIGKQRVLQFTILDRIIEDCRDYQEKDKTNIAKSLLGISPKKQQLNTIHGDSESKAKEVQSKRKQDMEDTLTFLERLKQHNKLAEVQNLKFNE